MKTMNYSYDSDLIEPPVLAVFVQRLKQIYATMDRAYNRAAGHYGFDCDGCLDSCCRSRFYHHTIIEYNYLIDGLITLNSEKRKEVTSRARNVVDETARADKSGVAVRLMCPLNYDELCILYPYRPMICRLHGIPHELEKPGQNPANGPGCGTFDRHCSRQKYFKFDRTPFYRDMAMLEQEVRQAMGTNEKIRMSIAQMILKGAERRAQSA